MDICTLSSSLLLVHISFGSYFLHFFLFFILHTGFIQIISGYLLMWRLWRGLANFPISSWSHNNLKQDKQVIYNYLCGQKVTVLKQECRAFLSHEEVTQSLQIQIVIRTLEMWNRKFGLFCSKVTVCKRQNSPS